MPRDQTADKDVEILIGGEKASITNPLPVMAIAGGAGPTGRGLTADLDVEVLVNGEKVTTANPLPVTLVTGGGSAFTEGSVLFAGPGGATTEDNSNFFYHDATNQLRLGLGSAAAPSYSFFGDPNTGIFSLGADQMSIATAGVARVNVTALGRTGFGTTPSTTLGARVSISPITAYTGSASTVITALGTVGTTVTFTGAQTGTVDVLQLDTGIIASDTVGSTIINGVRLYMPRAGANVTASTLSGLRIADNGSSTGVVTTAAALNIEASTLTTTTSYGILVASPTGGASSNYGVAIGAAGTQTLWVSSNADNTTAAAGVAFGLSRDAVLFRSAAASLQATSRLGINVAAGSTTLLSVGGTHPDTGTSVEAVRITPTFPATATGTCDVVQASASTPASAFTMTTMRLFQAVAGTIGSGSTITNLVGYFGGNLGTTGVTNAYGAQLRGQSGAATLNITAALEASSTSTLWVSSDADNTSVAAGMSFGLSRDTVLFRGAQGRLDTGSAQSIVGSSTARVFGANVPSVTHSFTGGTAQTGNFASVALNPATLTNVTTAGTIPDAQTLHIVGAPIAGGSMTITRAVGILVQTGADTHRGIDIRQNSGSQTGELLVFSGSTGTMVSRVSGAGLARFADGTNGSPGYSFHNDTDSGMYRIGTNNVGIAVGGARTVDVSATSVKFIQKIYPPTDAAAEQSAAGLYAGTGAPNDANGADGDIYFRSDGGALTTIYQRRSAAWVGIV